MKEKEDLEKFMTLKRDKKKESVTRKLLEVERNTTADLIDKQSEEMMGFISAKRVEYVVSQKKDNLQPHDGGVSVQLPLKRGGKMIDFQSIGPCKNR